MIETPLVSCDDHLDLNMLPARCLEHPDVGQWGERAPHIEINDKGMAQWVADGASWGFWSGKAFSFSDGPKPILTAYDRGGIDDTTELRAGHRSCGCRTWTATGCGRIWCSAR